MSRSALLAWVGIIVTVAGAVADVPRPHRKGDETEDAARSSPSSCFSYSASLGFGLSQVFSKMVADSMDVWTLFFWRALGNGAACVAFTIRPSGVNDLVSTLKRPTSVGLILFTEGALVFVALAFLLGAIYSGPVSLVSTVMATRPLFVFALGIILSIGVSNVLNEPLERKILLIKTLSIVMTIGGVTAVTFSLLNTCNLIPEY